MYNTYIQVSRFAIKMLLEKFVATNWSIYPNAIVNNALFHSNSCINQILPRIIHILRFFSARLAAPYFEINVLRSGLFRGQRNLEVHTSPLHYCTFGLGKDNDQQNLSEMIM